MIKNKKITFLHKQTQKDNLGQELTTWPEEKTVLSEISGITGKLYYESKRNNDEETVLFKIRYSKYLEDLNKEDYRIKYKNTVFKIVHLVNVYEKDREIHIRGVSINE